MGYMPYCCGFQRLTTSGVVGDSGKPVLVCGYGVEAGAAAVIPFLKDGATSGSTPIIALGPTVANRGAIGDFPIPVMFPNGCYASFVTNTNAITVFYILQSVSS